jgi:hypothetical protein
MLKTSSFAAAGLCGAMALTLGPTMVAPQLASAAPTCTSTGANTTCTFAYTGAAQTWRCHQA